MPRGEPAGEASSSHCPVVLVSGFLGMGEKYWGEASHPTPGSALADYKRRVIVIHVGPVSSLHDRVCELFYRLKGGRIDYGEEHSREFGHDRFGELCAGEYPEWDEQHPIHVVGHSFGGCTALLLQRYLHTRAFGSAATTGEWIRSITTISSPLRGATAPYLLGASIATSGSVHPFSPGWWLSRFIHFCELVGISPFQLSPHWKLSWRHGPEAIVRFITGFIQSTDLLWTRDNAALDLCVHVMTPRMAECKPHSTTYYRSYATSLSIESPVSGEHHWPRFRWQLNDLPVLLLSFLVGRFHVSPKGNAAQATSPPAPAGIVSRSLAFTANVARTVLSYPRAIARSALASLPTSVVKRAKRTYAYAGVASALEWWRGTARTSRGPGKCDAAVSIAIPATESSGSGGRDTPHVLGAGFDSKEWWKNDGCVSTSSQHHPFACNAKSSETAAVPACVHTASADVKSVQPKPGVWHSIEMGDSSHIDIVPFPARARDTQTRFFSQLWTYLDSIDPSPPSAQPARVGN